LIRRIDWQSALPQRALDWAVVAAVAGIYVGTAKLGIELSVAHGVITPVWAPTGVALASLLLFGPRLWPAVAIGAFVANATSDVSLAVAAGIAVGNTLEAAVGAYGLRRLGFRVAFERVRDVLWFVGLAAVAATTIAATNGVTVLHIADNLQDDYGHEWLLWWFGDAAGALLVTPLLLVWAANRHRRPSLRAALEFASVCGALAAVSAIVFLAGAWRYPYFLFPLFVWATLRFRQVGAATTAFLAGALATAGVVADKVPIGSTDTEGVQILQALIAVVAITVLVLAASLTERESAVQALRQAQELTHIGSWEWNVGSNTVTWSDELYRIFGLEPQSVKLTYDRFLERVHPDDRARVDAIVRRAGETRQPFVFEHRVVLPDGRERIVLGRGRVETDELGTPLRMVGTGQDITQQKQVDDLRESILATVSHELRTPLTAILGFALTLQERRDRLSEQEITAAAAQIVDQTRRLEGLLRDLLDLDRHRRGAAGVAKQPTALAPLVERVAAARSADVRRVELTLAPVTARVDPAMVERIVDNLLANALKHTPPDTPVVLTLQRRGADVLIVVDDRGPGVLPEHREAIFDLFRRGPAAAAPGVGVGLAIVAQFAALHGGRAWVEDAAAGGASFRVLLPDCVSAA
jgi:PAS domain S-box-containing protein